MWFLPSYGRPENLERLFKERSDWPEDLRVVLNVDDPTNAASSSVIPPWIDIEFVPAGSRIGDVWREMFARHPNEPFYGLLSDDMDPKTEGWHQKLVEAAGRHFVAVPNGQHQFPRLRNICVIGGDLVRAMGGLAPSGFKHNFLDDVWEQCATDFELMRPLKDVIVEHKHWLFGTAEKDETYDRGSADIADDRATYTRWLNSDERRNSAVAIASMLGRNISLTDTSKIKVAICIPIGTNELDFAFHRSLQNLIMMFIVKGISYAICEAAGASHIGKARERVLWKALNYDFPDATHVLYLDDDMGFDAKSVMRLICSGHEFCGAAGRRKIDEPSYCCNFKTMPARTHAHTRFVEVRHVGFAFVLLARSVIDKMCKAYPQLQYKVGPDAKPEWALFLDLIDMSETTPDQPLGERLSEDYAFCQRWIDMGGEIWLDQHCHLVHAGRTEYAGKLMDVMSEQPVPESKKEEQIAA